MPVNKTIARRKALMADVTDRLRAGSAGVYQADPTDPKALRELRATVRVAVTRLDSLIEIAETPTGDSKES